MLIRERLEQCDFSNSEQMIVDYMLKEKIEIRDMTTKEIAQRVFVSPSTLVRVAHKMGFGGWNELKEAIDDTHSLLTHDDLQKAILIMRKASYMGIYAASNNLLLAREFQHNMARIGKRVDICHYHSIPMLYVFPAILPWEVMAVIFVELVVDLLPLHPIKSYYL